MKPLEPTFTINVDGGIYVVAQLPQNIQEMISLMDDWRQKEATLTSDLTMVAAALRDLKNSIYVLVQAHRNETSGEPKNEQPEHTT